MDENSPKLIQSVQRAIDILNCFDFLTPSLTLNDISERTELNINTTRGLINTLVANKLLIHDKTNNIYQLGYYFIDKASVIQKRIQAYINIFKPFMDKLADQYHVSASIQMINQESAFSIYCAYPKNAAYYIIISEYTDLPKHATSSGKLLLDALYQKDSAYLNKVELKQFTPNTIKTKKALLKSLTEVHKNQYAQEIEESTLDVGSLAVPIYDAQGHLVITVSATFFVKNLDGIKDKLLAELKHIASSIAVKLGTDSDWKIFIKYFHYFLAVSFILSISYSIISWYNIT